MIIGLCGYYSSGKSIAAAVLAQQGVESINVDAIGHWALEQAKERIIHVFGSEVCQGNTQSIDRKQLGRIVFTNTKRLAKLEEIVHPIMKTEVEQRIKKTSSSHIIIDAALLFTMGLDALCDVILLIRSSLFQRIIRAIVYRRTSLFMALRILGLQRNIIPKSFFSEPDIHIVNNNRSKYELQKNILSWWAHCAK